MSNEMKIRFAMAALYGAGCLAIYVICAFIAWNLDITWHTRFAWVIWTIAASVAFFEVQNK